VHLPRRHEVLHAYSSHTKVRRVFGERKLTTLDEGLQAMAAWVRQRGARTSRAFEGIEVLRNLPAAWLRP
jgi:UDP-glucose 4-epimerase